MLNNRPRWSLDTDRPLVPFPWQMTAKALVGSIVFQPQIAPR
jgi:hypothetical protein